MSVKVIPFTVQPEKQLVRHDLGTLAVSAQVRSPEGNLLSVDLNTKADPNYVIVGIDDQALQPSSELELVITY